MTEDEKTAIKFLLAQLQDALQVASDASWTVNAFIETGKLDKRSFKSLCISLDQLEGRMAPGIEDDEFSNNQEFANKALDQIDKCSEPFDLLVRRVYFEKMLPSNPIPYFD